ncbi:MAG TPA: hypothetical protein VF221_12820 [Chloroflexota bacterium]
MRRDEDGVLWYRNELLHDTYRVNLALSVNPRQGTVALAHWGNQLILDEGLSGVALPALASVHGALVLHASACSLRGRATLFTAPGGSGKTSLVTGLVAAGWEAMCEDQAVVEFSSGAAVVWPGAPWVRLAHDVRVPPPIHNIRFRAKDKLCWDIDPWMRRAPAQVERVVFLEPPGGPEPLWEPVDPAIAIGLLGRQATWHQGLRTFGPRGFDQLVELALGIPCYRLRLPRSQHWLQQAVRVLDAAEVSSSVEG